MGRKHQVRQGLRWIRAGSRLESHNSSTLAAPTAPGTGSSHRLAQATDSHHATLGELVSAQVSCGRRGSQGGNSLSHTNEDGVGEPAPACMWVWAHIPCQTVEGEDGQVTKWVEDAARTRGRRFPTSEKFLVSTDSADTYFLVDHIHSAEAGR